MSLGSSMFSGQSSPNSIFESIGLTSSKDKAKDAASTANETVKNQLDSLTSELDQTKQLVYSQKDNVDYLNKNVPSLNSKLDTINQQVQQQNQAKNNGPVMTNIPTFYISIGILILMILLGLIYNKLLTKNILDHLDTNGVFDVLAKSFKKGDFQVKMDDKERPFTDYWEYIYNTVVQSITRARFVLLVIIFLFVLSINLFLYTIIFRGNDVITATKMVSIICAVILITTFLVVNNQTMNKPFENVIGYQMIRGEHLTDLITSIFQHKFFEKKNTFPGANLYYDFIVSTMTVKNYPTVLEELYKNSEKYDFKINTDEVEGINKKRVTDLYKLIITKNSVGHICWMFFASLVSTIISLKYLFAAGIV